MVTPRVHAAGTIAFGVSGDSIKLGDGAASGGWIPTYGPGNNIVINGSEISAAWTSEESDGSVDIRYARSTDNGQSWERSILIARGDYEGNGVAMALGAYQGATQYHFAFGTFSGSIYYANLNNLTPIEVTGGLGGNEYTRSIAADQQGIVYVCYDANNSILCSRLTTDATGVTLDPAETALLASVNNVRHEPAIAVDSAGTLYGVWSEYINGVWEMVLAKRISAGNWDYKIINRTVDLTVYNAHYASIDIADVAGTKMICVAWGAGGIISSCTTDEGVGWETTLVSTADNPNNRPSIGIASDGTLSIAWGIDIPGDIRFARYTNKWDVVTVDNQYYVSDVKMDLDANGMAHLVYPGKGWETLQYTRQTQ